MSDWNSASESRLRVSALRETLVNKWRLPSHVDGYQVINIEGVVSQIKILQQSDKRVGQNVLGLFASSSRVAVTAR